mgnify:CR=1 FL=1
MSRSILLLLMFGLAACSTHAAQRDPHLSLKKWGLAYCIAEHVEGGAGHGGAAMGGYFQLGSHESEEAYANVRWFFDDWVQERPAVPKTIPPLWVPASLTRPRRPAEPRSVKRTVSGGRPSKPRTAAWISFASVR